MISNVRFVLVRTTHPGNIGAAARAIHNMAAGELWLVAPREFPHPQAAARASAARELLAAVRICGGLAEAVDACCLVLATSARQRRPPWPLLDARSGAARLLEAAESGPVAVVFGQERTGLSNEDLAHCNGLLRIPTAAAYSSLNLAMAVQILAYEVCLAAAAGETVAASVPRQLPTAAQRAEFLGHLERLLLATGFLDPAEPKLLMPRLRRLCDRADIDFVELQILRGILNSMEQSLAACRRNRNGATDERR